MHTGRHCKGPPWLQFQLRTRRILLPTMTLHLTRFWIISLACQRVVGLDALLLWFASTAKAYLAVCASDSATFRCLDGICTGAISVSEESTSGRTITVETLSVRPAQVLSNDRASAAKKGINPFPKEPCIFKANCRDRWLKSKEGTGHR